MSVDRDARAGPRVQAPHQRQPLFGLWTAAMPGLTLA